MKWIRASFVVVLGTLVFAAFGIRDFETRAPVPLVQVNTPIMRQMFEHQQKLLWERREYYPNGSPRMEPATIRLSDRALISVDHPWTPGMRVINATETMNEIQRRLFADENIADFDVLFVNSPDPEQAIGFFLDRYWNRIIFAKKAEEWIRSYGERHGPPRNEFSLAYPLAIAVDISPANDLYVADTDNGRILKLHYASGDLGGEGSYSFTVPGVSRPVDICLPCPSGGTGNDNIWIADEGNERLVEITRAQQVLHTVEYYSFGGQTYRVTFPRSVVAENFPWPRIAFVDASTNALIVCDPASIVGTTIRALAVTEFTQNSSRLERIGLDATKNWWVADAGLRQIHLFDYTGGAYLASFTPFRSPYPPRRFAERPYAFSSVLSDKMTTNSRAGAS